MANIGGRQDGDLSEEFQSFIQVMSQKGIYPDAEFKAAVGGITGTKFFLFTFFLNYLFIFN